MKLISILLFLFINITLLGQIPTGYYDSATGTGYTLKTQLSNIITNGHVDRGYPALWTLYANDIRDVFNEYENDGSLFDIYTENPDGQDPFNFTSTDQQDSGTDCPEGGCYNREHLIPQSHFDDFYTDYVRNDAHHVIPSDKYVNGKRGNYPFGVVSSATYISSNGSKLGNNLNSGYSAGYSGIVFEPVDDFKGDVARSFFYFATRYENDLDDFYNVSSADAKVMFDGSTDNAFSDTFLNILLAWHEMDPVSEKEIVFNNRIYDYQNNRNPYIDHPEWIATIWGTTSATSDLIISNIKLYPNPVKDILYFDFDKETKIDEIKIFSILGKKIMQSEFNSTNSIDVSNLQIGLYLIEISSENTSQFYKFLKE